MFTKLFTKRAEPYETKGRWYKVRLESAQIVSSKSDMVITPPLATQSIHIDNPDYAAVDYFIVPDGLPTTNTSFHRAIDFRTDGKQYLTAPAASYLVNYTMYVYCVKIK